MKSHSLFGCFILLTFFIQNYCRMFSNSMSLFALRRNNGWNFLDRMNLDRGTLQIQLKMNIVTKDYRAEAQYKLQLAIVPSSIWEKEVEAKCTAINSPEERRKKMENEIVFTGYLNKQNGFAFQLNKTVELPLPIIYQFVLRDCTQTITHEGFSRDTRLNIQLELTNNGNYNSATQEIYAWLLPLFILCQFTIIILMGKNIEEDSDNWFQWFLKISMFFGLASLIVKFIGYTIYAWINGSEYQFFDFTYLFLHSTSDSIIIVLLIQLSYGWIATYKSISDFDMYVPLACMLGLINVIMTLLNKVSDGEHDKYHMFDTISAYVMIFFRLAGLTAYVIGVIQSCSRLKRQEKQLRKYFYDLAAMGIVYFTFVPILFFLIELVSADYRKETMFFVLEGVKLGLNMRLTYLVRWKQSSYRKVIDQSFMEIEGKYL